MNTAIKAIAFVGVRQTNDREAFDFTTARGTKADTCTAIRQDIERYPGLAKTYPFIRVARLSVEEVEQLPLGEE